MKLRGMTNVRANLYLLLISSVAGLCLCELCLRFFYPKYRHLAEPGLGQGAARIINKLHIPYLILDARGRLPLGEEVTTDENLRRENRSRVRAGGRRSNQDWKNNEERGTGPDVASSRHLIRPGFDVSIDGKRLIYSKAVCLPVDRQPMFFLHVTPVDENDLPESRAEYGFANLDFDPTGFQIDERGCTIESQLPDYAIRHIRTGQYTPGEDPIWKGEFFVRQSIDAERIVGPAAAPGRRLIRPGFDVSIDGKRLIYSKAVCLPVDRQPTFFLHVTPVDENDLPESRAEYGFANLDFDSTGFQIDERECTVESQLPDYAIRHIRTGQYTSGGDLIWKGEFFVRQSIDAERIVGPAATPGRRLIRPGFDVSIDGKRLLYSKAVCLPVDKQPMFFLHVTPVDENDLPESRAEYGFANLDFDPTGFQIDERGCMIESQLPDYAIRYIRTGQYTPGEGLIWEGVFFIQQRAGASEGRLQWVEGEEMRYQVFIDPAVEIISLGVEN